MSQRMLITALSVTAAVVACAGPHPAVTPAALAPAALAPAAWTAQRLGAHAQSANLPISFSIQKPVLNGSTLKLYAYPLTWRGPLAVPPAQSLALTAGVGAGAAACTTSGGGRTCSLSASVPKGIDAVVALLLAQNQVIARGFATVNAGAGSSLSLVAGNVPIASLALSAPTSLGTAKRSFSVGVAALTASGAAALLGQSRSIVVNLYGPAGAVPQPQASVNLSGATAPFVYSGTSFVNPMTVTAVTGTMSNTTRIFPQRTVPLACAPLGNTPVFTVGEPSIPHGFSMTASVAGSTPVAVSLDTGSTSFAIAQTKLSGAQMSQLIGPGQYAQQTYEPSGLTIRGYYYLAPVTLSDQASGTLGTTVPMEVFVTTQACPKGQPCVVDTGTQYMGVGFGRPTPSQRTEPGLMNGPMENAFLQLTAVVQGTMHPGFVLTGNSVTVGVNAAQATGFQMEQLTPFRGRAGDWNGPPACLSFSGSGTYECGSMLLDIGIASMFIRPTSAVNSPTSVQVVSPQQNTPLLNYQFPYPVPASATPPAPSPNGANPIDWEAPGSTAYVNTGRNALAAANYLYDAGCGKVGFQALSSVARRRLLRAIAPSGT